MAELSEEDRMDLTRAILDLLDGWDLSTSEMIGILDMPGSVKSRNFARFRDDEPFPSDPQVMKRISYLLRISDALRTTYPTNPHMRNRWMKQSHRRFRNRAPLNMIIQGGESGLVSVLCELDCTFAWDLTGSKA